MINLNIFLVLLTFLQGDVAVGAGGQAEPVFNETEMSTPKNPNPVIQECANWPMCPPDETI